MKKFWLITSFLLAGFLFRIHRYLLARLLGLPRPRYRVRIERALLIPMSDGTNLSADHYRPVAIQKCPTILVRTPYGRNAGSGIFGYLTEFCAYRFAEQGYEVIVQDTRGRFDSEGKFEPFFNERADAQATFDWLAGEPWFDGQVGMWGSSYLGIVQWAAADNPLVKALVPGITTSHLYDAVFPDGAIDLGLIMRWMSLLRIQEKRRHPILQLGILLEVERDVRPAFYRLPIAEADRAMRSGPVDYFERWMHVAINDSSFATQLQSVDLNQVNAPVHLIGGWYDFFLRGLLDDYTALKNAGHIPYLTIGPWTHFSHLFLMPSMLKPGLEWFDANLKDKREHLRSSPVRLYIMGVNQWRNYTDFPLPSQPLHYYLSGKQKLAAEPHSSTPSYYCYDPAHPAPIVGGAQFYFRAGARDNRKLERRADVLTFTTAPLHQPVEIIGEVAVELHMRSSSEFTDFYARLCDVFPDGRSINICDGLLRIKPSTGEYQSDGSYRIRIDLWATAYRFIQGHSIRLLISSSAHPRWARHTNTAHPFTDKVVRTAEQIVYHDIEHPSRLILPCTEI
jgi:putative CocE/NonD family hydrolase